MKIQLPFGRVVDTDIEPPDDPAEIVEARKKLKKEAVTADPGKDGSLTQVLLGYGVLATAKELFSKEKIDAAAKLVEELKTKFTPCPSEDHATLKLENNAKLLVEVSRRVRQALAEEDEETMELLTQIILSDLRDSINEQIRYIIDPMAEKREAEQKEAEQKKES